VSLEPRAAQVARSAAARVGGGGARHALAASEFSSAVAIAATTTTATTVATEQRMIAAHSRGQGASTGDATTAAVTTRSFATTHPDVNAHKTIVVIRRSQRIEHLRMRAP